MIREVRPRTLSLGINKFHVRTTHAKLGLCRLAILCSGSFFFSLQACFCLVGILFSLLPASLSELQSVGQAVPTDMFDCTHHAHPVLLCPRWPCDHRMYVIAQRLGSPCWLAHAARCGLFLGASPAAHQFHSVRPLTSVTLIEQLGDDLPLDIAVFNTCVCCMFNAHQGAGRFLYT